MSSTRMNHKRSDFKNFVSIAKHMRHNNLTMAQIHVLSPFAYHVTVEKLKYWIHLGLTEISTNLGGTETYRLTKPGMTLLELIEDKV